MFDKIKEAFHTTRAWINKHLDKAIEYIDGITQRIFDRVVEERNDKMTVVSSFINRYIFLPVLSVIRVILAAAVIVINPEVELTKTQRYVAGIVFVGSAIFVGAAALAIPVFILLACVFSEANAILVDVDVACEEQDQLALEAAEAAEAAKTAKAEAK